MGINDARHIIAKENESPINYADRLGELYTATVSQTFKKDNGQFFTPVEIAQFMGNLANSNKTHLEILDPGCGTGILTCALVENIVKQNPLIKEISLTAYETDSKLISLSEESLSYLKEYLNGKGILFRYVICVHDFVLDNYAHFDTSSPNAFSSTNKQEFDFIISNPPYFKLSKNDERVKAAKSIINGQPNIYSIFLALATQLLKSNGEMIFIVPRSFSSGRYFNLFRDYFFKEVELNYIHLFDSRKDTFSRDNVLQETLILKASKRREAKTDTKMIVSTCSGLHDIWQSKQKVYLQKDLIDLKSKEKIIHLPINRKDEAIIELFKSWTGSLNKYNIQISTGPVVAYRTREYITETHGGSDVSLAPLYWLHNVVKMEITFPSFRPNKGQYIQICDQTKPYLIPNKNYIFLRRFSSKDDRSRLIAAPYFPILNSPRVIGVENKLNYIYRPKGYLDRTEIIGIAALLNSNLFDSYFRTFNGNVNVSATELRAISLPPLDTIKSIGEKLILLNDFSLESTNRVVDIFFELNEA